MSAIEREKVGEKQEKERREKEEKKKRKGMLISSRYTRGGKIFLSLSFSIPTSLHRRESLFLSLYFFTNHVGKEDTLDGTLSFGLISLLSLSLSLLYIYFVFRFFRDRILNFGKAHTYTHTYAPIVPPRRNPFKTTDAAHETVYETISLSLASPFSPDSMDWTDRSIYTQSIPRRVFLSFLFFFAEK